LTAERCGPFSRAGDGWPVDLCSLADLKRVAKLSRKRTSHGLRSVRLGK
jgi:hypothetical protein